MTMVPRRPGRTRHSRWSQDGGAKSLSGTARNYADLVGHTSLAIKQACCSRRHNRRIGIIDVDVLGDAAGGQCRAQRGGQPDGVLGEPEPGGHHRPRVIVQESEQVGFPAGDSALAGNGRIDRQRSPRQPRTRLVVALIAVHALTNSEITAIRDNDVSLHDMLLAVRGSARPLDAFTASAIDGYLRWRRDRWPRSANPHLIITRTTAGSTSPVNPGTIRRWLKGTTTPTGLRQSCLLGEAEASGGDPLLLASMFGIVTQTGLRYTGAFSGYKAQDHASVDRRTE